MKNYEPEYLLTHPHTLCQNANRNLHNSHTPYGANKEDTMWPFSTFRNWYQHRNDTLRHLAFTALAPTTGKNTIALSPSVFTEIDPDFKKYTLPEKATELAMLNICELRRNATFRQIFEWVAKRNGRNIDALCLTQSQIVKLASSCPHWLIDSEKAAIALFKPSEQEQLCVVVFSPTKEEKFRASFFILDYPVPWLAERNYTVVFNYSW